MTNQEYLISCANTLVEFITCELNYYITFEPLKFKQIGDSLQLYVNDTILHGTYLKLEETNTINGFGLFGYFRDEKIMQITDNNDAKKYLKTIYTHCRINNNIEAAFRAIYDVNMNL